MIGPDYVEFIGTGGRKFRFKPASCYVDGEGIVGGGYEVAARLLGELATGNTLEVGLGCGWTHAALRKNKLVKKITLVELFPEIIERYHPRACRCKPIAGDFAILAPTLEGGPFDTIILDMPCPASFSRAVAIAHLCQDGKLLFVAPNGTLRVRDARGEASDG